MHALYPSDRLAVRGYAEVLRHYWGIVRIRNELIHRWTQSNTSPAVFIGVDAPDFNLDLSAALKARGIPTVQFVCPSIWAWRAERVHKIHQSVDHVLCLFPFEAGLLHSHGIGATFVGHPLASVIPMNPDQGAARRALGIEPQAQLLALLPGSRISEIKHLTARFIQAAQGLKRRHPHLQVVLPVAPGLQPWVEQEVRQAGGLEGLRLLDGQSHLALQACDLTLVASGTATLEAALFKRPMVIAYNMHPLSWWITRRKKLQPWVGLPNILLQDRAGPEGRQEQATPEAMAQARASEARYMKRGGKTGALDGVPLAVKRPVGMGCIW